MSIVQGDNIAREAVSPQPAPRSNKTVKGVLALAAAGALLAGGAGTLALWGDEVILDGGEINAGQLRFTGTTAGTWSDISSGTTVVPIPAISAFQVAPGDVLTYSLSRTVRAEGNNLEATLAADPASVTGDQDLLDDMTITTTVTIGGTPTSTITEANDNQQVDVTVRFDFDDESLNPTQLQSLDLSALELTLNQNPR